MCHSIEWRQPGSIYDFKCRSENCIENFEARSCSIGESVTRLIIDRDRCDISYTYQVKSSFVIRNLGFGILANNVKKCWSVMDKYERLNGQMKGQTDVRMGKTEHAPWIHLEKCLTSIYLTVCSWFFQPKPKSPWDFSLLYCRYV